MNTATKDFRYKVKPWEHQAVALDYLSEHPAALLDYEMGTGKTKIVVDWIANQAGSGRHLIICPKKVIQVWIDEMEKWFEGQYWILGFTKKSETAKIKAIHLQAFLAGGARVGGHRVVVINYESAWRADMRNALLKPLWDTVVLDESHRIKDPKGRASKFCAMLGRRALQRMCLSGTPLPHSPLDVYAQARFLDPEVYGPSWTQFRARYAILGGFVGPRGRPVQVVGYKNEDDLARRMATFTIQARTDDVLDLPEAHHIQRNVELSPAGLKHYQEMERLFITFVEGAAVTAANALVKLLRLQQITSGFLTTEDGKLEQVDTGKEDTLIEILEDLPPGEKVVVFCRFTSDIKAVLKAAEFVGRKAAELSGQVNELEKWKAYPDITVLAAQIQAGKEGISLVEARYAIYYSIGYSLGDYIQSLARIRRPGQKARRCVYYHLVAKGTIDVTVYSALAKRKVVVDAVLDDVRRRTPHGR